MFFRIVIAFVAILFFGELKAQSGPGDIPSKNIVKLTQTYLGFNVYELPLLDRIKQIIQDSSNTIDTLIAGTETRRFYLRVSCKSFNPFAVTLDSVKLELYEALKPRNDGANDTAFVIKVIGIAAELDLAYIQTEFERMSNKIDGYLDFKSQSRSSKKDKDQWKVEYYLDRSSGTTVRLSWRKFPDKKTSLVVGFSIPFAGHQTNGEQ